MFFKIIRNWKRKKQLKKKQVLIEDIKRGKALLEMIDNHLIGTGQTRKQRKQFWQEFYKSSTVRGRVYDIIEKAFEDKQEKQKKEKRSWKL